MTDRHDPYDEILAGVDEDRRDFVKQLVTATAFAVPLAMAASLDGSPIREARAQVASGEESTPPVSSGSGETSGSTTSIPVPATVALLGGGLATLAYLRRRARRRYQD